MNTRIYTFSGTGTALSIADQVCDIVGGATVELIPRILQDTINGEIKAGGPVVGFVFPNYFGGIPGIVSTFIRKLNMEDVRYIFAIVNAGGGQGYSIRFLEEELKQKGKELSYGRYVASVSNYIVASYYAFNKFGDQREKALRLMHEKIRIYANEIKEERIHVERSNPIVYTVNRLLSSLTPKDILKDTSRGDVEYSAGDNCTGCGICRQICQANNIVMEDNKPSFQHKCYRCMACIQYCPQNAILFNGRELRKPRYFHPDFPAKEMIHRIRED